MNEPPCYLLSSWSIHVSVRVVSAIIAHGRWPPVHRWWGASAHRWRRHAFIRIVSVIGISVCWLPGHGRGWGAPVQTTCRRQWATISALIIIIIPISHGRCRWRGPRGRWAISITHRWSAVIWSWSAHASSPHWATTPSEAPTHTSSTSHSTHTTCSLLSRGLLKILKMQLSIR